jgi:hypothetical protein
VQPRVIDALFHVLLRGQDVPGDRTAVRSIFTRRFLYGQLASVPVELNDFLILHVKGPSFHPYTPNSEENLTFQWKSLTFFWFYDMLNALKQGDFI